jgi:hypothetical protein
MKGIYLTEEGKKYIEDRINEIEKQMKLELEIGDPKDGLFLLGEGKLIVYKTILSTSTTLPIEESWNHFYHIVDGTDTRAYYPNGVIIQPK